MKTNFVEFGPWTTVDTLDLSEVCELIYPDPAWCLQHPAKGFPLRTRLLAMNVFVPDHFTMPDKDDLSGILGTRVISVTDGYMTAIWIYFLDALILCAVFFFTYMAVKTSQK